MNTRPRDDPLEHGRARRSLLVAIFLLIAVGWRLGVGLSQSHSGIWIAEGARATYVLTPKIAGSLGGPLGKDFEITSSGIVLLQAGTRLIALRADSEGREVSAAQLADVPELQSLVLDATGALLITTPNRLGQFSEDADQKVRELIPLAATQGARLVRSSAEGKVYLYGGPSSDKGSAKRIVAISREGQVENVIRAPAPLTAVTETGGTLYFATSNEIYALENKALRLVIRVPGKIKIVSLAVPAEGNVLYFSTPDRVYGLKGLVALSIATNVGGTLRLQNGALYILDAQRGILLRLDNLQSL